MKRFLSLLLIGLTVCAVLSACSKTIKLDKDQLEMTVGDSAELSAGEATRVNWESSNDDVASVNGGVVTAKSAGSAVITASLENGEKASCSVSVKDKLVTEITLSATGVRVEAGKTIQLTASYKPSDASHVALSWESSDENIASVNEEGYVTGIAEGTATVTCKSDNDIKATCTVNVGAPPQPTSVPTMPPATVIPTETTAPSEAAKSDQSSSGRSSSGELFPDSSVRYLTTDEISAKIKSMSGSPMSGSFGQDAVNEIYARHGYVFTTPSIRAYYEKQAWYRPDPSYNGSLNQVEQYNIGLLSGY